MSLPGVILSVQNGNLGLAAANGEKSIIYAGVSTAGIPNTLSAYGDINAMTAAQDAGEVLEAAAYGLSTSGAQIGILNISPTIPGALSSVTHTGTGTATITVADAPHKQINIVVTTGGALGTGQATFQIGSGAVSAPVTLAASYLVPGTYTVLTFPAGTYVVADTYTISILGVVTHTGTGPSGVTQASSPIDAYTPTITIGTAGAVGTAQITYSLDGTSGNTSAAIVSAAAYAIPGTGIYLTLSGTFVAGDTYTFKSVGPTYSNANLVTALNLLETTYISSVYSLVAVIGLEAAAASDAGTAWASQTSSLETVALALFNLGVYIRFLNAVPTVGSVTGGASGGTYTANTGATDAALATTRAAVSAVHVGACAGDELMTSVITGLSQRRNGLFGVAARAVGVEASQNIGFVGLGGVPGVTALYRDETTTPGLDAVGFITMRSFPGSIATGGGLPGFYITDGHTMDVTTSDYYPLTNARVIDLGCTIARASSLGLVNSKIPTTTRNGNVGVITEVRAQQIDSRVTTALTTALVNTDPADAVAAKATVNRTHNILADGNLIIAVAIQPFGYARTITVNIGLATSV